jgi:fructosamine-3-kinase
MITATLKQSITDELSRVTGSALSSIQFTAVGGGSINDTYRIDTNNHLRFFCKINSLHQFPFLFQTEKAGLELLAGQQVIRIPQVIALLETGAAQVLILEWIEQGLKSATFWKTFGERLAALHHCTSDAFGLSLDNYMGALPQYNRPAGNWCEFFRQQRLQPQVELAVNKSLLPSRYLPQFEKLYTRLPDIFPEEPPCLLHGDLWSGKYLCDEQQQPVLIDPAIYYGHRSVDLAMTTLFGGFDRAFYDSYHSAYPLPAGYRQQWEVCNVYPLLIHLNLFGESYLGDILRTIERY